MTIYTENTQTIAKKNETTILLVEDTFILQKIHGSMLENLGFQYDIAANQEDAIRQFQNGIKTKRYSLVLLDIGLPHDNEGGIKVCRTMRNYEQMNTKIPIIALTANGEHIRTKCLQAGCNDFYTKPITQEKLMGILLHWITTIDFPISKTNTRRKQYVSTYEKNWNFHNHR